MDEIINENEKLSVSPANSDTPDTAVGPEEKDIAINEEPATDEYVEIVGVKFRGVGKEYFFSPAGLSLTPGTNVITETARGMELGVITRGTEKIPVSQTVAPLRPVLRVASDADIAHFHDNEKREKEALVKCEERVVAHNLDMKLTGAEYTFDNKKLIFYFTSDGRVDFRELVKDLASVFHTRIELRQIGIRDEAKMIGGLGICGRPFCCSSFLNDFGQVSIKMAKEQNLSLSSTNISGPCGRLMCCLRYEHAVYEEEIKKTPAVGTYVKTPDGNGTVVEINPLAGKVKVNLSGKFGEAPKEYHRDSVSATEKGQTDIDAENSAKERKEARVQQAAEREAKRAKRPKPKLRKYEKPDFEEENSAE